MRMGTRWTAGEQPPASVSSELATGIKHVEDTILSDGPGQPRPRWTLTWLEGSPIAELDTGIIVKINANGRPEVSFDNY